MAEKFDGLNESWTVITNILSPDQQSVLGRTDADGDTSKEHQLDAALAVLDRCGVLHLVPAWFRQSLQDDIRRRLVREFWAFCDDAQLGDTEDKVVLTRQFALGVDYLHRVTRTYKVCLKAIDKVERVVALKTIADDGDDKGGGGRRAKGGLAGAREGLQDRLVLLLKSFLFSTFPKNFRKAVEVFYFQAFILFRREEVEPPPPGQSNEEIMERFSKVNLQLHDMGLLEHVAGTAITSAVTDHIYNYIHKTCRGDFETPYLQHFETYLDTKVLEWLRLIYSHSDETTQSIDSFRGRLMHFICENYAEVLIDQLFSIIIEFPDSEPALKDLRQCLEQIDLRSVLVTSLRTAIEVRLLHPGVNTTDVLTAYISAIRALRALDPAGVLLELVCEPVRKYLRSREDTVRCIVSSLTDNENSDLFDELLKGAPQTADDRVDSDDESESWETWQPDPVDANPETASKRRKEQDIISTLVNVYGSQELFVTEYCTLLADRLLSPSCGNIATAAAVTGAGGELERELRYLELLKLRFGEAPFHSCQVMLKDVADSRRINSRIMEVKQQNGETCEMEMNALILSAQFWPAFRDEKISLPAELPNILDAYTQQYKMLKGNRTLVWKPHLGSMNIEIELKDQTLQFTVSTVQAAVIMKFQEQCLWSVADLGQALEMAPSAVRRKLAFWQGQGLVEEVESDVFVLVEERRAGPQEVIAAADDDERESAMASAAQQRELEMAMFWTYITGMLQNLDNLPLERIHSMLRMFAVPGPDSGEFTQQQLKAFLDRKVREQKLIFAGGVYKLPKN